MYDEAFASALEHPSNLPEMTDREQVEDSANLASHLQTQVVATNQQWRLAAQTKAANQRAVTLHVRTA